jgi:hypothetical protein
MVTRKPWIHFSTGVRYVTYKDGSVVALGEGIPMVVLGTDVERVRERIRQAKEMTARFLNEQPADGVLAYLRARNVEYTVDQDRTFEESVEFELAPA